MGELFDNQIISELKEIMGDEIEMLLDIYIEDSRTKMIEFSEAIQSKEPSAIRRIAHSLKGSSKNVGANELSILYEEAEKCGLDNNLEPLPELHEKIVCVFEQTCEQIHKKF